MTTFNTVEELVHILDQNPDLLEAIRARVLTKELLELPEKHAAFVDEMRAFVQEMRAFESEMRVFVHETQRFMARTEAFMENMRPVRDQVATLWGDRLENLLTNRMVGRMSGDLGVRGVTVASSDRYGSIGALGRTRHPFHDRLEDAADQGVITFDDEQRIYRLDLVGVSRRRGSRAPVWIVAQAASSIKHDDITTVRDGAAILRKALGEETVAVVYGFRIDGANQEIADRGGVRVILVNPDSLRPIYDPSQPNPF